MELFKETRFRCDVCNKQGEFTLRTRDSRLSETSYCRDCLACLYNEIGRELVPKSPQNIMLKQEKAARRKSNGGQE